MPVFARTGRIVDDNWHLWDGNQELSSIEGGILLLPELWQTHRSQLLDSNRTLGLIIHLDQQLIDCQEDLGHFNLIVINFTAFSNGQGFSMATLLRERYGFRGELRASGDILFDQLFYLKRCGFDSFELDDEIDRTEITKALNSFSEGYQQACDQPLPLFRWRT
ncbi:DUF934 domain-containing protein [Maricurvus nonylphenolicus]|uniref:DUF934 domain-containing protein n=1 Tax=Maricurvus nonylphenolicus TaxID=1008307 RepID=UPI0036F1F45B